MAGIKGMKGGGGRRQGAGRKPQALDMTDEADPLKFLLGVMQGKIEANPTQLRAAVAAVQYTHIKSGDGGKKDAQAEKAKQAAEKFGTPQAPLKLVRA